MNNNLIPAATVLVLRDSDDGMEVLMVKRSKRPPFENLYVFPGGKIDKEDHFDDYQKYCNVLNNKIASEKLGVESGGLSYWIACIRECFEEIGILLAKKQSGEFLDLDGADKERFDSYRDKLIKNEINFNKYFFNNFQSEVLQFSEIKYWYNIAIKSLKNNIFFYNIKPEVCLLITTSTNNNFEDIIYSVKNYIDF